MGSDNHETSKFTFAYLFPHRLQQILVASEDIDPDLIKWSTDLFGVTVCGNWGQTGIIIFKFVLDLWDRMVCHCDCSEAQ